MLPRCTAREMETATVSLILAPGRVHVCEGGCLDVTHLPLPLLLSFALWALAIIDAQLFPRVSLWTTLAAHRHAKSSVHAKLPRGDSTSAYSSGFVDNLVF